MSRILERLPSALAPVFMITGAAIAAAGPPSNSPSQAPPRQTKKDSPVRPGDPGAQDLFRAVLRRHATFRSFRASFTETPFSRATGGASTESGLVYFKRPDEWRWEYRSPEPKLVLVRGTTATIAIKDEPDVAHYDLGDATGGAGIGSLLAGGENLLEAFEARFEPGSTAREPFLRLVPVALSDEYDYVLVRLGSRDLRISEVTIVDPGGNRLLFHFDRFEPDVDLSEGLFQAPVRESAKP